MNPIDPQVFLTTKVFVDWFRDNVSYYRARGSAVKLLCLPEPMEAMIDQAYVQGKLADLVTHKPLNGSLRTYLDGIKVRFIKNMGITRSLWVLTNGDNNEDSVLSKVRSGP